MKSPSKAKKRFGLFIFALIASGIFFAFYPIYKSVSVSWPKIADPENLIKDCENLLRLYPEGHDLPKDVWPKSVSEINPQYVFVEDGYIKIVLSSGGIGDSWGIIVKGDDDQITTPRYAEETRNHRIYRFE